MEGKNLGIGCGWCDTQQTMDQRADRGRKQRGNDSGLRKCYLTGFNGLTAIAGAVVLSGVFAMRGEFGTGEECAQPERLKLAMQRRR